MRLLPLVVLFSNVCGQTIQNMQTQGIKPQNLTFRHLYKYHAG